MLFRSVRVSVYTDKVKRDLRAVQMTIALVALAGILLALGIGWTMARRVTVLVSWWLRTCARVLRRKA